MPKTSERIKLLAGTQIFSPLDGKVLKEISAFSSSGRYKKGQLVFAQDSPGEALYIVREGEISITRKIPNEADQEIARFVRGDSFGEMDLMTRSPRNAEARATVDSILLRFPGTGRRFEDLLEAHPVSGARVLHSFLTVTAGRIRKANNILKENSPWIQELRKQVYGDKLTGLYNKTFLEEKLQDYLKDKTAPLSLLMFKPDNFKQINDTHGHEAGDQTLILMAGLLRRILPEGALAVRYMGNELAAVLPNTGKDEALVLAKRIRDEMRNLDLRPITGGERFALTLSFGLALFPDHAKEAENLIALAHELPLLGRARGGNVILLPEDK